MWFTKRKRAQSTYDYETWIEGGVSPTLNAMDNTGDSRPTVLIIDGRRTNDVRVTTEPVYTLEARMGTGGNNVPFIAIDAIPIQGTIISRQDHNGPSGPGFGKEGDPSYTLDSKSLHAVAGFYESGPGYFTETNVAGTLREGGGGTPPNTIVQADAYDEYNDTLGGDTHHALRAGTRQSTGVLTEMHVRRLTPLECERLMGWPDNHTQPRADGKTNSDTNRYKMCGNGVASPVATWIAQQINATT